MYAYSLFKGDISKSEEDFKQYIQKQCSNDNELFEYYLNIVFISKQGDHILFTHKIYQDFFIACYLLKQYPQEIPLLFKAGYEKNIIDPNYIEIFSFWIAGISQNNNSEENSIFIDTVIDYLFTANNFSLLYTFPVISYFTEDKQKSIIARVEKELLNKEIHDRDFTYIIKNCTPLLQTQIVQEYWNTFTESIKNNTLEKDTQTISFLYKLYEIPIKEHTIDTYKKLLCLYSIKYPDFHHIEKRNENINVNDAFAILCLKIRSIELFFDIAEYIEEIAEKNDITITKEYLLKLKKEQRERELFFIFHRTDTNEKDKMDLIEKYKEDYIILCLDLNYSNSKYSPTTYIHYILTEYIQQENIPSYLRLFCIDLFERMIQSKRFVNTITGNYLTVIYQVIAYIVKNLSQEETNTLQVIFNNAEVIHRLCNYHNNENIHSILDAIPESIAKNCLDTLVQPQNEQSQDIPYIQCIFYLARCIDDAKYCKEVLSTLKKKKENNYYYRIVSDLSNKCNDIEWIVEYYKTEFIQQIERERINKNRMEVLEKLEKESVIHDVASIFTIEEFKKDIENIYILTKEPQIAEFILGIQETSPDINLSSLHQLRYNFIREEILFLTSHELENEEKVTEIITLLEKNPPNQLVIYYLQKEYNPIENSTELETLYIQIYLIDAILKSGSFSTQQYNYNIPLHK